MKQKRINKNTTQQNNNNYKTLLWREVKEKQKTNDKINSITANKEFKMCKRERVRYRFILYYNKGVVLKNTGKFLEKN